MKRRRFSKNRFDLGSLAANHVADRKESEGSIIFFPDDKNPGKNKYFKFDKFRYELLHSELLNCVLCTPEICLSSSVLFIMAVKGEQVCRR